MGSQHVPDVPRAALAAPVRRVEAQHVDLDLGGALRAVRRTEPVDESLADLALLVVRAGGGARPATQRRAERAVVEAVLGRGLALPADPEGHGALPRLAVDHAEQRLHDETRGRN